MPKISMYIQFSSVGILVEEFHKILLCKSIRDPLLAFIQKSSLNLNSENINLEAIFYDMVLPNLYLVSLPDGIAGFNTVNSRIFIKDYAWICGGFNITRARAAIYIILVHEMARFIKRIGITTREDMKKNATPPSVIFNENGKGESGREIKMIIFGFIPTHINEEAASIFINLDDSNS